MANTAKIDESGFWAYLKKYAKKLGRPVVENLLILFYAFPEASAADKAIIAGAIAYFLLPLDVIPDILPGGFVDDIGIIAAAVAKIRLSASPEVIQKAENKAKEWFDGIKEIMEKSQLLKGMLAAYKTHIFKMDARTIKTAFELIGWIVDVIREKPAPGKQGSYHVKFHGNGDDRCVEVAQKLQDGGDFYCNDDWRSQIYNGELELIDRM